MLIYFLYMYIVICSCLWILTMKWLFPQPKTILQWTAVALITFSLSFTPLINIEVFTALRETFKDRKRVSL
jgi:hypothetical protein